MCIGPTPTVHVTMDVYVYVSRHKFVKPTGNLGHKVLQNLKLWIYEVIKSETYEVLKL